MTVNKYLTLKQIDINNYIRFLAASFNDLKKMPTLVSRGNIKFNDPWICEASIRSF